MPPSDPWLARQNAALKLKGHGVTLDVAGGRVRLRANMPPRTIPRTIASPGAESKQQPISTGFVDRKKATESLKLAQLQDIRLLLPDHLVALVEATATVARALNCSDDLMSQLREPGRVKAPSVATFPVICLRTSRSKL